MSKKIESNGFIANWNKIINSQCREDAEKDNKAKAKIIADDYRKYNTNAVSKPAKIDEELKAEVKKDLDKLFDNLLNW